ncbi:MAG: class A beta-lactamase-related serine hydrolase [Deltaproteobacteria bacterium]|nr:MAG: class A beta-lactamase-related serine hydrolase [Deltaproteobacteria bacterium]
MLAAILADQVARRATPGGVLIAADAGVVTDRIAFGRTHWEDRPDIGPPRPVTVDTPYDLASLTKPIATVGCLMQLVARGDVDLDAPVRRWLPELAPDGAARARVRDLLCHSSGLPAHLPFYRQLCAGERDGTASARDALVAMAARTPLAYAPGTRAVYSDLGFILLGALVERATNERLDRAARRLVFEPLGMRSARFADLLAGEQIAGAPPTEECPHRGLVCGRVHDQNAYAAGGICGHAGLFAAADDVAAFAAAVLGARPGFDRAVVDAFLARSPVPGSTWRYGWDTPSPEPGASQAGDRWPRTSGFGHTGFTGTAMWLDRVTGRFAVLLTNSIHPRVQQPVTKAMRREVMDAVVARLDELAH